MCKKEFVINAIEDNKVILTNNQKLFINQAFDGTIVKCEVKHYQMINRIAWRFEDIVDKYKKNITCYKIKDILNNISEGLRKYKDDNAIISIIYNNYYFMETEDYKSIVRCINCGIDLNKKVEYKIKVILQQNL